jgi:hypothetical protein
MLSKTYARHQTQWAAQFAVASELCKRGYEVSFTLGHNTPLADLIAINPNRQATCLIDVKGLGTKNYWQIKKKETTHNLFYILALVPEGMPNQFFIMSQAQVNQFIDEEFERCRPEQKVLGLGKLRLGVRWRDADQPQFRDAWNTLLHSN